MDEVVNKKRIIKFNYKLFSCCTVLLGVNWMQMEACQFEKVFQTDTMLYYK